jgi:hypothetical protein
MKEKEIQRKETGKIEVKSFFKITAGTNIRRKGYMRSKYLHITERGKISFFERAIWFFDC